MTNMAVRFGIQRMGILCLLIPASLWGNNLKKEPTVIFFTAYCYEADMSVSETIFPALPAETSIHTVQNMAKISGDYTRQLQSIYGYRRFQLLATFGGSIALNLKGISHKCVLESKTKDQKVVLSVSAWPQKADPVFASISSGNSSSAGDSREPQSRPSWSRPWPAANPSVLAASFPRPMGKDPFISSSSPIIRSIDSQASYNESMAAFRQVLQMTAGVNEFRDQQLIPSLNHWLAQRHPEIQRTALADPAPPPSPPPPPLLINDDGRQVHHYEYDTAPSPVGGLGRFQRKITIPSKGPRNWRRRHGRRLPRKSTPKDTFKASDSSSQSLYWIAPPSTPSGKQPGIRPKQRDSP